MISRNRLWSVFVIPIIWFAAAEPAAAQQQLCGYCYDEYDPVQGYYHIFGSYGALSNCEPNTCHYEFGYGGLCGQYHHYCQYTLAQPAEVKLAIEMEQIDELQEMIADSGGRIVVNRAAGAIDLFSCDGEFTASLRAPQSLLLALAT